MGIARHALKGTFWNFLANSSQQLMQFGFFIFMARILDAGVFGIMALAMVSIDLLSNIARMGMGDLLVREEETDDTLQQAWFGLLGIGLVIMAVLYLIAQPVAQFYKVPVLADVIYWMAPVCLIQNVSIVHEARLRKHFAYDQLAVRVMASTFISGMFGLTFAFMGYGLWSLVLQRLVAVILQSGLIWAFSPWRPKLLYNPFPAWRSGLALFHKGSLLMFGQLLQMFNTRAIDLLVGFFLGIVALGYLRIAWRISDFMLQFAIQPITNVALSSFSRLQNDRKRLQRAYIRMVQVTSLIAIPVFFGMGAIANNLIPLVFGTQWSPSISLMQITSLMAVAAVINMFFAPLMTAIGQNRIVLRQGIIQTVVSIMLTLLASQFHITIVMLAHVVRAWLVTALNLWLEKIHAHISIRKLAGLIAPALSTGAAMALLVWALGYVLSPSIPSTPVRLAIQILFGALFYAGTLWFLFPRMLHELCTELADILPNRLSKQLGYLIRYLNKSPL